MGQLREESQAYAYPKAYRLGVDDQITAPVMKTLPHVLTSPEQQSSSPAALKGKVVALLVLCVTGISPDAEKAE
eukprot:1371308-Amphidinium_carterae.1